VLDNNLAARFIIVLMNAELRKYLKALGRKGGKATVARYGKKQMKAWGNLGGRPRKDKGIHGH
jgi:hypothetical protein